MGGGFCKVVSKKMGRYILKIGAVAAVATVS